MTIMDVDPYTSEEGWCMHGIWPTESCYVCNGGLSKQRKESQPCPECDSNRPEWRNHVAVEAASHLRLEVMCDNDYHRSH